MRKPKDKDGVFYRIEKDKSYIVSAIEYDCGCIWEIEWDDLSIGKVKGCYNVFLCEKHDPTIE